MTVETSFTPDRHSDHGWRYEPARLFQGWDTFHQRWAFMHPAKPTAQRLGYTQTFMGWTLAEATACCHEANAVFMEEER